MAAPDLAPQTSQGAKQASIRAVTATANTYEGDWHALFDLNSIPVGTYDERLLRYLNVKLSASYTNLPEAMQAFAAANGATNWSSLGTFSASAAVTTYRQPIAHRTGLNSREDILGSGTRSLMTTQQVDMVKPATDLQFTWLNGHINGGGDFIWTGYGDGNVQASVHDRVAANTPEAILFGGNAVGQVLDGQFITSDSFNYSLITPHAGYASGCEGWIDQRFLIKFRWNWAGATFPTHLALAGTINPTGTGEGSNVSTTNEGTTNTVMTAGVLSTDNAGGWQAMPVVAITGLVSTPHVAVAHIGDSIGNDGANETAGRHVGWSAKGALNAMVPTVPWNSSGGSLGGFMGSATNNTNARIAKLDMMQAMGFTHVLDSLGTNDWPNNTTAAQMRTWCIALQALVEARGMKYMRATLPPRTNGSNSATANAAANTERAAFHAALRADAIAGTGPGAILFDLAQFVEAGHLAAPTALWATDLYNIAGSNYSIVNAGSGYTNGEVIELQQSLVVQVNATAGAVTSVSQTLRSLMFSPHALPTLTGIAQVGRQPTSTGSGLVVDISLPAGNSSCFDTDGIHILSVGHGMLEREFAVFLKTLTPPTGKDGSGLWTWS